MPKSTYYRWLRRHAEGNLQDKKGGSPLPWNKLRPEEEAKILSRARQEHWRMLGNSYCTRPDGVPCEYETICESCPCFSTTVEFLPILQKQKQDAEEKGQTQRVDIFTKIIKIMKRS